MVTLSFNYLDVSTLSKQDTKTQLQSHFNIISAIVLQCKELSNVMPIQNGGSLASDTLLNTLECNTSTPYEINGGRGAFIPKALNSFTEYKATQIGSQFYFSTSTTMNSSNDEVLQDLQSNYSANQFIYDAPTASMKFYLSR